MPIQMIEPEPIRIEDITKAVDAALLATDAIMKVNFDLATGTWDELPKWDVEGPKTEGEARVLTRSTDDIIFMYVDMGTEPHLIPKQPKVGGSLKFMSGFIAKTKPGRLAAGPGASFGEAVFAKQVHHPGNEPRNITQQVADLASDDLEIQMAFYMGGT